MNEKEPEKPSEFYATTASTIKIHYAKKPRTDADLMEEVSLQLKRYRAQHGLSIEALAKKVGVSKVQIIRWEKRRNAPSPLALATLQALKIM